MKKRKIAVTTGTRAEYGILRLVLDEIKISRKINLINNNFFIFFNLPFNSIGLLIKKYLKY